MNTDEIMPMQSNININKEDLDADDRQIAYFEGFTRIFRLPALRTLNYTNEIAEATSG